MRSHNRHSLILGAALLTSACFLPTPPVEDATTAASSSSDESSSGDAPTTSGTSSSDGGTSTGEPPGETSTTTTTTGDEPSSSGTTEFSLPQCPYEPSGGHMTLVTRDGGPPTDLSMQPCGTETLFDRLKLTAFESSLSLIACGDSQCGDCDPKQQVELGLGLPDPFTLLGGDVQEGACFEIGVRWERASDDPALCTASRVVLRRIEGGAPKPVPSLIYRVAGTLEVTDQIGDFALTAALAGIGPIHCPCAGEGDCCREPPGSRLLQFTVDVGGEQFVSDPLEGEQEQNMPFGVDNLAKIALIRGHVPSECGAPGAFEWVFRHPETEN